MSAHDKSRRSHPVRVLVAAHDPALRDTLADLVSSQPDFVLVGAAPDADAVVELAGREPPDVALLDATLPGGGPRAAREIRRRSPRTRMIALCGHEEHATVVELLKTGVVGYLPKSRASHDFADTIRRSMRRRGSVFVEVTAEVIDEFTILLASSERLTEELRGQGRKKNELVQGLARGMFTPLSVIQGFALMLGERGPDLSPEELGSVARGLRAADLRIRRLVGNLSALSRLDGEEIELGKRAVRVSDLLEGAASEFPDTRSRLAMPTAGAASVKVWADRDLAVRALVTVLDNAVTLSPPGVLVHLGVQVRPGEADLTVSDRGPGVPPDLVDHIFEAFSEGEADATRPHRAPGIGLYLARRIMLAHGGRISVRPRPGGGSVFALTFRTVEEPGG